MRRKCYNFMICLMAIICFGLNSTIAMARGMDAYSLQEDIAIRDIIREKGDFYLSQPDFYEEANEIGLTPEELLYQKAAITYQVRTAIVQMGDVGAVAPCELGNNGQVLWANVPLIMQLESYTCGPTSILQVLYGLNCANNVSGSTNDAKLKTLAKDCGTTSAGTYFGTVVNVLNSYSPTMKYESIVGTTMTVSQFQGKVETSLFYNAAPILHSWTQTLPYYGGHNSGHFIAVRELDKTSGTIKVRDCNKNISYYGEHQETIADVFSAINYSNRHLICLAY